jgi:hypothetical protein
MNASPVKKQGEELYQKFLIKKISSVLLIVPISKKCFFKPFPWRGLWVEAN